MTDTDEAAPHFTPVTKRDRATGRATARATGENAPAEAPTRAARLRARGASVARAAAVTQRGGEEQVEPAEKPASGWWWARQAWWLDGPNAPAKVITATREYHVELVDARENKLITGGYRVFASAAIALSVIAALLGTLARPGRLVLALIILGVLVAVAKVTGTLDVFTGGGAP